MMECRQHPEGNSKIVRFLNETDEINYLVGNF